MFLRNFLLAFLFFLEVSFLTGETVSATDKALVLKHCSGCHDMSYLSPRSKKAWELTVYRMREMIYNKSEMFSKDDAEQMIDFLSLHLQEYSQVPIYDFFYGKDNQVQAPIDSTAIENEELVPPKLSGNTVKVEQMFSAKMTRSAKFFGYSSIVTLMALLISGIWRRKLKKLFIPIHRFAGFGLLLSLTVHTTIYILKYGNPPVLWYWLGILGVIIAILTQFSVILKTKIGPRFVVVHATLGVSVLILGILHWLIAYL